MEFIYELGLFIAKAVVVVGSIGVVLGLIFQFVPRRGSSERGLFDIQKLNDRFKALKDDIQGELLEKKQYKHLRKEEKKRLKNRLKNELSELNERNGLRKPCVFVLDFDGDIAASATSHLREEVTAILSVGTAADEVILKLESGGGLVTSYGLAASQLLRLKQKGLKLTVCVDKVAASGGYMMACTADHIVSAPFAILGSIGVIAQVPNFNRLLKKHDVDYREVTAGEFKRTVTIFGEITEPGMAKFKSQIEDTHVLFKNFVSQNRPKLEIQKVATGEYWYGTQALGLALTDQIATSDEIIMERINAELDVYSLRYQAKKKLTERLSESFSSAAHSLMKRLLSDARRAQIDLA
jgi:serine protease SohB